MERRIVKVILLCLFSLLLLSSCKKKEYAGFAIDDGMIQFPVDDSSAASGMENFYFPLELYKLCEASMQTIANVYNDFSGVSVSELKRIDSIREGIGSIYYVAWLSDGKEEDIKEIEDGVRRLGADKTVVKDLMKLAYKAIDEGHYDFLYGISRFANKLEENLYSITSAIKLCTNYKNGDSWFNSMKDVFEYSRGQVNQSVAYIEKYFPTVQFVHDYSETGYARNNKQ